jgi:ArsR family transcriptional regulator
VNLVRIHECLCDRTRLRIVHLLLHGPLCVCHLQEVMREPQVKISRHLAYLRQRSLLAAERCGQWMIYRLPAVPPPALAAQLACLQDAASEEAVFRKDRQRLDTLKKGLGPDAPSCVRQPGRPRRRGLALCS